MNAHDNTCFAYADRRCRILTAMKCNGRSFSKTHAQYTEERKQSVERLKRLGLWEHYKGVYGIEEVGVGSGGDNVRV